MVRFLNRCIQIILLGMLTLMVGSIVLKGNWLDFVTTLVCGGLSYIFYRLYKKDKIKPKVLIAISLIMILLGLGVRLYYMLNLDLILESDFKLYYDTASAIACGSRINDTWYLSFNGYVYVFATILSGVFKIFGTSVLVALFFNLVCQIGTVLVLNKILERFVKKEISYLLCAVWFILPTVVEANFLISTETLFMFVFSIFVCLYFKWKDVDKINYKAVLKYFLLGLVMSLCNNIRPVMIIFVIAILIDYVLNSRKLGKGLCLLSMMVVFALGNFGLSKYVEVGLKEPSRSGALAWSLYFGSSYSYNGLWNEEDSLAVGKMLNQENGNTLLLEATLNRYKDLGILKSSKLFAKKFYNLWGDVNGNYNFILLDNLNEEFNRMRVFTEMISYVIILILILIVIKNIILEFKNQNYSKLFLELFFVGYVLANMLVVVNGRYNFPGWFILIVLCAYSSASVSKRKALKRGQG